MNIKPHTAPAHLGKRPDAATASAAVLGATGYTGQELVGLLAKHPRFQLVAATSESEQGQPVVGTSLRYSSVKSLDFSAADVVFSCLPHGDSGELSRRAAAAGAVAIDLSSDLRAPDLGAVYGLPELWRSDLRSARLIANPGCYPTGVLLGLAPAVAAGVVDLSRPIMIDAASGVTGAGRSAKRELLFGEVAEDFKAYGVGNQHRHVPEMRVGLSRLNARAPEFVFTPHLLPVQRGILETMYVPLTEAMSAAQAVQLWSDFYVNEPFVEVHGEGLPALKSVVRRNVVALGFSEVIGVSSPLLIVVAALDNLTKGAAGQALQNANIALGFEEALGLPL
jgi:N-acetyl-gamma-glutamyl-phosphate reductase